MKILLALHQFPPVGTGGTEDLARWTARALVARGHDVEILSAVPRRRGEAVAVPPLGIRADGVPVHFVASTSANLSTLARIGLEYDDLGVGRAFGDRLDALRPDLVHFYHLSGLTASAVGAVVARGIPCVFSATDFWVECPTVQLMLPDGSLCEGPDEDRGNCVRHLVANRLPAGVDTRWVSAMTGAAKWAARVPGQHRLQQAWKALQARSPRMREAFDTIDVVLAPTAYMRSRLIRLGMAESRIHVVPYGVAPPDPKRVRMVERADGDERLRIAFVGSLSPSKGAHLLLEALAGIRDLPAEVSLWGGRTDESYARRLDALAAADPRVRLAGTFAEGEFGAILAWADLLVIPSLWYENAPLVLLEALAHRCPVVVSDVPGLTEPLRAAVDGWEFRRGDVGDLAQRLVWAAGHRSALTAVREAPRPTRTIADYMNDLMLIYDSLHGATRRLV